MIAAEVFVATYRRIPTTDMDACPVVSATVDDCSNVSGQKFGSERCPAVVYRYLYRTGGLDVAERRGWLVDVGQDRLPHVRMMFCWRPGQTVSTTVSVSHGCRRYPPGGLSSTQWFRQGRFTLSPPCRPSSSARSSTARPRSRRPRRSGTAIASPRTSVEIHRGRQTFPASAVIFTYESKF